MPHPSAPNAYPSGPNAYPSGPDSVVIVDVPSTSRTGLPLVAGVVGLTVSDTAPSGSRTGTPTGGADRSVADIDGASGSYTGLPVDVGPALGVIVVSPPPAGSRGGNTATGTVAVGWTVPDATSGSSRTGTPTGGANHPVVDGGPSGSYTVTPAGDGPSTDVSVPAGPSAPAFTYASGDLTVGVSPDAGGQPTFRTGRPVERVDIGIVVPDTPSSGSRTGVPVESVVLGYSIPDVSGTSGTGSPVDRAAIDIFAPVDTVTSSRTGTPYQPPGITLIWSDAPTGAYTVSQSSTYSIQIVDQQPGGTSSSRTGLPAGTAAQVGYPVPDPRTVTILNDDGTPFGSLVPSLITVPTLAPRYRMYLFQTKTGRVIYELPFRDASWGQALNNIGSCSAVVEIEEFYDAASEQDERDPKALFAQFVNGQYNYSLALVYGNTVVWAGPYSACSISAETPTVQIGGSEFASMLTRRLLVRSGAPAASSDVILGPYAKPHLAYQIMNAVTAGDAHALPWSCSDVPSPFGDHIRSYWGYDLSTAWDALSTLAKENDGPDFRFDPYLAQASDGNYVLFDMKIGRPLLANPTEWMWDCPTNASVAWSVSVANLATEYYATGAGQDRDRLIATASSSVLLDRGAPAMELVDDLHSSTTIQSNLQKFVDADMALYNQPDAFWSVQVQASGDPLLGTYRCGDTFKVRIERHAVIPDGVYTRRITSLSGGSADYVAIGSSDNYVVQSTTSTGVQIVATG